MKGLRGRILRNLKSIPQVKYIDSLPSSSSPVLQVISPNAPPPEDVPGRGIAEGKENFATADESSSDFKEEEEEEERDAFSRYRRPDLNSPSLFDPDLLAAFRLAVAEFRGSLKSTSDSWPDFETLERGVGLEKIPEVEMGETREKILGGQNVPEDGASQEKLLGGNETLEEEAIQEEKQEERKESQKVSRRKSRENSAEREEETVEKLFADEEEEIQENEEAQEGLEAILEEEDGMRPSKLRRRNKEGVVLYTTSLGSIRKTFEDCNKVRSLLQSLRLVFDERDLSMHLDYRDELRRRLGGAASAVPPHLFIDGMLVGGADLVLGLHESGSLVPLLRSAPVNSTGGAACRQCAGARFLLCAACRGGRKVFCEEGGGFRRCSKCNENGLVVCVQCRSHAAPGLSME